MNKSNIELDHLDSSLHVDDELLSAKRPCSCNRRSRNDRMVRTQSSLERKNYQLGLY